MPRRWQKFARRDGEFEKLTKKILFYPFLYMEKTPEKRLLELSKQGYGKTKKIFTIIFLLIGYWQAIEYFTEKPNVSIYLENSKETNNQFITKISINNGSQSIISSDVVNPITIEFSEKVLQTKSIDKTIKNQFTFKNNNLSINFDLLNKNETNSLYVLTSKRPYIKNVNGRIKDIKEILYYDYEKKLKPLDRFLNIWIILLVISIFLFIDALLVILKDYEFQLLKNFIVNFPLNLNNIEEYIETYGKLYSNWKVNIKPDAEFMQQIIRNLFKSFPHKTEDEIYFIKRMSNFKTEMLSFYRVRTVFVSVAPILFIVSLIALILNYYYFEFDSLNNIVDIHTINKFATTILLILGIVVVLFPSRTMNYILIKQ